MIPRPAGLNKNLMRGGEVPDWLPLLDRLRREDPSFSTTGETLARLTEDFNGARTQLQGHFRDAAGALPLTETDVREAWQALRRQDVTVKGQKRFKPFAAALEEGAASRIETLRADLIRIAKQGPETIHNQKMIELAGSAGDEANKVLRARRELHFKTCNMHFGEALAEMTPQELIRVDRAVLERMAHDHYLYLSELGMPSAEVLAHGKTIAREAIRTGAYPEATRLPQILTEAATVVSPAATETTAAVTGWTEERRRQASEKGKLRAQQIKAQREEVETLRQRVAELERGGAGGVITNAGHTITGGTLPDHALPPTLTEPPPLAIEPPGGLGTGTGHAVTNAERAITRTENVIVQGEKWAARESSTLTQQATRLASEEGMISKVLSAVKANPALAIGGAAVGALGLYAVFAKSNKDKASHAERIRQEQAPAATEHKTEPFKPDADVQMGGAAMSKDIARSGPDTPPQR